MHPLPTLQPTLVSHHCLPRALSLSVVIAYLTCYCVRPAHYVCLLSFKCPLTHKLPENKCLASLYHYYILNTWHTVSMDNCKINYRERKLIDVSTWHILTSKNYTEKKICTCEIIHISVWNQIIWFTVPSFINVENWYYLSVTSFLISKNKWMGWKNLEYRIMKCYVVYVISHRLCP